MGTGVLNTGLLTGPSHVGKRCVCTLKPACLPPTPTRNTLRKSFLRAVSQDVQTVLVVELLGGPRPVARLALCCRELLQQLRDPRSGLLRVSTASFGAVQPALEAFGASGQPDSDRLPLLRTPCSRLSLASLRRLRLDLLKESGHLPQRLADQLLSSLGDSLVAAKRNATLPLEDLCLQLASFADYAKPLRPSAGARASLVAGLASLPLRRLELSFLPLRQKDVQEEVADAVSGKSLTFTSMLEGLSQLEHIVLTHNSMFGDAALELAKALRYLLHLSSVDFSRNRIPADVWKRISNALGRSVKLHGLDSQTTTY